MFMTVIAIALINYGDVTDCAFGPSPAVSNLDVRYQTSCFAQQTLTISYITLACHARAPNKFCMKARGLFFFADEIWQNTQAKLHVVLNQHKKP